MATDFAYTFHVRAEKLIAEQVFSIILEAGMQYGDDQSGINYSQDEQGFGLQFCGVATDEPESKLRTWLTEFSAGGVEIDWMMLSNDGGAIPPAVRSSRARKSPTLTRRHGFLTGQKPSSWARHWMVTAKRSPKFQT